MPLANGLQEGRLRAEWASDTDMKPDRTWRKLHLLLSIPKNGPKFPLDLAPDSSSLLSSRHHHRPRRVCCARPAAWGWCAARTPRTGRGTRRRTSSAPGTCKVKRMGFKVKIEVKIKVNVMIDIIVTKIEIKVKIEIITKLEN